MTRSTTIRLPFLLLFAAVMGALGSLYVDEIRAIERIYAEARQ